MPPSAAPPDPDRILGCLLAGAVGDALGAPVEGLSLAAIRERHGPYGVAGYTGRTPGAISDETQLTLFTAQALAQASVRARARGIGGATLGLLQSAYLAWLRGQGEPIPEQPSLSPGRLASVPALMSRRGPGRTTLAALRKAAERREPGRPLGKVDEPINGSKGSAGAVRAAPCGFGFPSVEGTFTLGCEAAALTHGDPSGQLPAGVLAAATASLVRGADLPAALDLAGAELLRRPHHRETASALDAAMTLARTGPPSPERLESLGRGFTAPEALAIGVYAALCAESTGGGAEEIGRRGLLIAVNHSGDSDSTGSVCGNLLGARHGSRAVPAGWRDALEVGAAVADLAEVCAREFGPNPPADGWGEPPMSWHMRVFGS